MKFSVLILAAVLACVGNSLASDDELLATPLFKEEGVSAQQRALLHKKVAPGYYGGCVAPKKEVFYIASNVSARYAYFRDRVLARALRHVYKKYGYRRPQVSYSKTKYFNKLAGKVQIKLVAKYPLSKCHKRAALRRAVTAVVKHYASHYKSM